MALPQPKAVAMAMPANSPITHPVRQWFVALMARRFKSVTPDQTPDGAHHLLGLLLAVALAGSDHAVASVVLEQLERHLVQRGLDRGDLREDVDAVALVRDHALDPADLAPDSPQALLQLLLVLDVAGLLHVFGHGSSLDCYVIS